MIYLTANQSEKPLENTLVYIAEGLPEFRKPISLVSRVDGPEVCMQDEAGPIGALSCSSSPASEVIARLKQGCISSHVGNIKRQRLVVRSLSVFAYQYLHRGYPHTIFINLRHHLIEDIGGPLQKKIEGLDREAEMLLRKGSLSAAFRANLMSLCMDGATAEEKALRSLILDKLWWRYAALASISSLSFAFVLRAALGGLSNEQSLVSICVAWCIALLGSAQFARDRAIYMSPIIADCIALIIGAAAAAVFAFNPRAFIEGSFQGHMVGGVALLVVVVLWDFIDREAIRRKLHKIEEWSAVKDGEVQEVEQFIKSLQPDVKISRRSLYFGLLVLGLLLVGQVVVLKLEAGDKPDQEQRAMDETMASGAKRLE